MFKDKLVIGAYFYGKAERLIDIAEFSRSLLKEIEILTPWSRPFDVSGDTKSTSDMLIDEDLSNFNDVLFKVWEASDGVYYDSEGNRTLDFSEFHTAALGVRATFSNFVQCQNDLNRVSIKLFVGHDNLNSASKNVPNSVIVSIPNYESGQVNDIWTKREVVESLMKYFIDQVNPFQCAAFSTNNTVYEINGKSLQYKFNWLTYLSVKQVCELLSDSEYASEYAQGLWFDFGRDVDTVVTPKVRKIAEDIGRLVVEAGMGTKRF